MNKYVRVLSTGLAVVMALEFLGLEGMLWPRFSASVVAVAAGLFCLVQFVRKPLSIFWTTATLVLLSFVNLSVLFTYREVWHNFNYTGMALAGWLLGLILEHWYQGKKISRGEAPEGITGAWSIVCARASLSVIYVMAGITKIFLSGYGWFTFVPIASFILNNKPLPHGHFLYAYAHFWQSIILDNIWFAQTMAIFTVVLETLGFLYAARKEVRLAWATVFLVFQFNVCIVGRLFDFQPFMVMLLFIFPLDDQLLLAPFQSPPSRTFYKKALGLVAATIVGVTAMDVTADQIKIRADPSQHNSVLRAFP